MPGMGASSASDYGLLAGHLYAMFLLTGIIGLLIAIIWSYGLPVLGTRSLLDLSKHFRSRPWNRLSGMKSSKREDYIRIAFGCLWVLDGFFQLRPDMPGGFVSQVANPSLTGAPSWVISIAVPFLNLWNAHPVHVDLITAWIQVLIGLGFLFAPRGIVRRAIFYTSLAWAVVVLIVGNGLGVFYSGAAWMTGAPAAIFAYGFAAVYLLAADSGRPWTRDPKGIAYFIGTFFAVGAVLQALPSEGYWAKNGISSMAKSMSQANQPQFIASSLRGFSHFAAAYPSFTNAVMVALPLIAAFAIIIWPKNRIVIYYAVAAEFIAWWLGMDFGIFSATATDVNSGLPIIFLTISLRKSAVAGLATADNVAEITQEDPALPEKAPFELHRGLLYTFPFSAFVISCVMAVAALLGPASSATAKVDSGGLQPVPPKEAPNFTLTNYNGRPVSLSSLRGRPIVLTFLDPICYDTCPLFAQEMVSADSRLGAQASKVALVAVVANPLFHSLAVTRDFTDSHHLSQYRNWYYLTGSLNQLKSIWNNYDVLVSVNPEGMVVHGQQFTFINKSGSESSILLNSGNAQIAGSYATLIYQGMKAIL